MIAPAVTFDPVVRTISGIWPSDRAESRLVAAGANGVVLAANSAGPLALGEPFGTLGGLVLPRGFALYGDRVFRLASEGTAVLELSPDRVEFVRVGPDAPESAWRFSEARSLASSGDLLMVAESHRVVVFDLRTLAVRNILHVDPQHEISDVAAGSREAAILTSAGVYVWRHSAVGPRFWLKLDGNFGHRVAIDRQGCVYVASGPSLDVFRPDGTIERPVTDAGEIRDRFDPPTVRAGEFRVGVRTVRLFAVPRAREAILPPPGQPLLDELLAERLRRRGQSAGAFTFFDADTGKLFEPPAGEESPAIPTVPPYVRDGIWVSSAGSPLLDSGIDGCEWDRMAFDLDPGDLPLGTRVVVESFASDDRDLAPFDEEWQSVVTLDPPAMGETADGLFGSQRGRFLRLRFRLSGDGYSTPRVRRLRVFAPRDSYLPYLPAIFRADETSRDFLERFLSVFRAEWAELEEEVESRWRVASPRAVPPDMGQLGYLAGWLGVPLESEWTPDENRRLLLAAADVAADPTVPDEIGELPTKPSRRGTVAGLRRILGVYLQTFTGLNEEQLAAFPVVIEGFRERRAARASGPFPAALPGANELGRVVVGESRLGEGVLLSNGCDLAQDATSAHSHRFRVLVPNSWLRTPEDEAALHRAIRREKPAHTVYELCRVPSRFCVGRNSTVGVDTTIGPAAPTAILDGMSIKPSILPPASDGPGILVASATRTGIETDLN